jgi:hypothetical protein
MHALLNLPASFMPMSDDNNGMLSSLMHYLIISGILSTTESVN